MKYSSSTGNKTRVASFIVAACLLTCAAVPAFVSRANAMTLAEAGEIAPGSYLWNPSLAPDGSFSMQISLPSQKAYVYRGGTLIGITSIASGKPGYETPDGTFTVLEKEKVHHSNKYDNAPMPYMQRLTWFGLALHGGHPHGYPASHGCIRLPMGFAAALFKEDTRGMEVVITGHARGRQQLIARRQNRSHESDDLQVTGFSNEQGDSNATPESGVPIPSALPESPGKSEAADQTDNGTNSGNLNNKADQLQHGEQNNGTDQGQDDLERSRGTPPQYLPPPPG